MNLMPLIPQAGFRDNEPPSQALLDALRARARVHIPQFTHCRQCRADAVGVPRRDELHRLPLRFKRQSPAVL